MRVLFQKYKSVLRFVVLFLGTYLVFTVFYSVYLHFSEDSHYPPDIITHLVAKQSTTLLGSFGYEAHIAPHETQPSMKLFVEGQFLARIVEGCNAVSIIILFIAFVVSFAQQWKKTIFFIIGGIVLIYSINVLRIAILAIALYHYPDNEPLLHGVVFPGIIYGLVFVLWMLWVRGITISGNANSFENDKDLSV